MRPKEITVIRDYREKEGHGWIFDPIEKRPDHYQVDGTVTGNIDAGDYTIQGYEDLVRIERKAGIHELFNNMTLKENRERFIREMERLQDIPYKYIIVESSLSEDIMRMGIPQMGFKGPPASSVVRWLYEIQINYNIVPIFAGDAGKRMALYIFEYVVRKHNDQRNRSTGSNPRPII